MKPRFPQQPGAVIATFRPRGPAKSLIVKRSVIFAALAFWLLPDISHANTWCVNGSVLVNGMGSSRPLKAIGAVAAAPSTGDTITVESGT